MVLFYCARDYLGLLRWLSGKEFSYNSEDISLIPGLGRSTGEGNGKPIQYSGLEKHGQKSLVGYSHGISKESHTVQQLNNRDDLHLSQHMIFQYLIKNKAEIFLYWRLLIGQKVFRPMMLILTNTVIQ